jgi:cyclohexanone monooxygenase
VPAHNAPLNPEFVRWVKANYPELRERARVSRRGYMADINDQSALSVNSDERWAEFERRWAQGGLGFMSSFSDLLISKEANDSAAEFVRSKIREIVRDPDVAEKLVPADYPIGTKRLCVDSHYFETYNRDNVTLVDVRTDQIDTITTTGLRTGTAEYELDCIVFATGFDAMTGTLKKIDIRGRAGITLRDKWSDGPMTYLGLAIAGFPNLFTITGPGSPSVLSNMMTSIEQHVELIADCIEFLRAHGYESIEATEDAEDRWSEHVREVADATLYPHGNSWWKGANVAGKPQVFMPYAGGVGRYRKICDQVATKGYEGFTLLRTHQVASRLETVQGATSSPEDS